MSRKITVYHLASDEEQAFLSDAEEKVITPEYAVAYCYAQENNRLSEFFGMVHESATGIIDRLKANFPIGYGHHSVSCGDWATFHIQPRART